MDKRVLIATIVSMGVVLLWIALFKPKPPATPPASTTTTQQQPTTTAAPTTTPAPTTTQKAPPPTTTEKTPTTTKAPSAKAPSQEDAAPIESVLEQPKHYKATFTNYGAAAQSWVLLDPQYKEDNPRESNKTAQPIDLVRTHAPFLPLAVMIWSAPPVDSGENKNVPLVVRSDARWTPQPSNDPNVLIYTFEDEHAKLEKRIEAVPGTYQVKLHLTVENKSDYWLQPYVQWQLHGWQDPNVKQGGMFTRRVMQTSGACYDNGKVKRATFDELRNKSAIEERGQVRWVSIYEQYFLTALAIEPSAESVCRVESYSDGSIKGVVTLPARNIAKKSKTEYEAVAFMGPKILTQMDAVTVGGQSAHLGDVFDYGWLGSVTEWLSRPMLAVLKAIHWAVFNWGIAIIVLTILIKAVTWFPTQSSMKSMKAMAKLKPEMDKLKERFGDDKNQLNMATMELYKKHGVNPLGGCLPILIQMPIYIALYSMLGNSVELYRSPFILWIRDLTAPDPYFVLPVLTGILMFVQQKTQPASPDPNQKMMMYLMPVMFTAFSIFLPSGLTIYILTNTVLTFVQQWIMNRKDKPTRPQKLTAKPARA